jgi:hypothetical protein
MKSDDPNDRKPVELATDRYWSTFIAGEMFVHLVSILWDATCIAKLAAIRFFRPR